ncbi:MAG: glycerophosphodiester phosphodiesterase [Flavobacteriales bacterium]|nr:glycerophosphodiester phosphodiesterase [Flavobacteriales bacterium]MBL6876871.1 glycerophosphodiester phosphodiesterase [Flavobacteriales bacterium]
MKKLLSPLLLIFLFSNCNNTPDLIVIGHRGAMGHALENTIESVEKAIDLKVDGIEIDVFKSKSGELIVYHDPSLSRLSNSNAFIEQISLDSIKKIELIGGLSIPTLNEVIDIIPEKIFLNIELKGENTAYETNKIIIKYLSESNLTSSKFIISSFRWDELKKFRNINKDIPIAILVDSLYKIDNAIKLAKEINAVALNPNNKFITKKIVKKIQSNNIKVYPYTINTPKNIKRMKSIGVDAIITDYPERINNN